MVIFGENLFSLFCFSMFSKLFIINKTNAFLYCIFVCCYFFNFSGISLLSSTQARHTLEHSLQNILEDKLSISNVESSPCVSLCHTPSFVLPLPVNPHVHTHLDICLLPRRQRYYESFSETFSETSNPVFLPQSPI